MWIPKSNVLNNAISFNFDYKPKQIRSIATQGKASSDDYVTEYFVQYSDDGEGWTNYVDSTGEIEVLFAP